MRIGQKLRRFVLVGVLATTLPAVLFLGSPAAYANAFLDFFSQNRNFAAPASGSVEWSAANARLDWQWDGNLVVYCNSGGVSWASGTVVSNRDMHDPMLSFQNDGNLVIYLDYPSRQSQVLWASNTNGHSNDVAVLQDSDSNLVIYKHGQVFNPAGALWSSFQHGGRRC